MFGHNKIINLLFIPDETIRSGEVKIDITEKDINLKQRELIIQVPGGYLFSAIQENIKIH